MSKYDREHFDYFLVRHGLSQAEFARLVGVHVNTAHRWVHRGRLPGPVVTVVKLIEVRPEVVQVLRSL